MNRTCANRNRREYLNPVMDFSIESSFKSMYTRVTLIQEVNILINLIVRGNDIIRGDSGFGIRYKDKIFVRV